MSSEDNDIDDIDYKLDYYKTENEYLKHEVSELRDAVEGYRENLTSMSKEIEDLNSIISCHEDNLIALLRRNEEFLKTIQNLNMKIALLEKNHKE